MRSTKTLVLVSVVFGWTVSPANAAVPAPVQWPFSSGGNGHYYEVVTTSMIWTNAKAQAETKTYLGVRGHLATITSAAENTFITSQLGGNDLFIGLTDSEAYGGYESSTTSDSEHLGWAWITGEPVTYFNWNDGEPNNELNMEDGGMIYGTYPVQLGRWNDERDNWTHGYVVEYPVAPVPEPSSAVLVFIAAALFAGWRGCQRWNQI